ncbi:MAG: hypothetical protein AAGD92_10260 [Pseudomonadota bacterium]
MANALEAHGVSVAAAPWNGDFEPFEKASLTVVRSTWDYFDQADEFTGWIDRMDRGARLLNPPSVLRWNMAKTYLSDLAKKGAPTPPMVRIAPHADAIAAAMDALRLDEAIVKPLVGGTASGLSHIRRNDAAELKAAATRLNGEALVQPFLPEIKTLGETSMIFFDGEFSHAVLKSPKAGDIRVQEEHGGSTRAVSAPDWAVAETSRLLKLCPDGIVYGRVDAILHATHMTLMEIELVEPDLFFTHDPYAADWLAKALKSRL